jgi:hypothetical protein
MNTIMRPLLLALLLVAVPFARADFFNFKGDRTKKNPMDTNEGGAAASVALGGTQIGLTQTSLQAQASSWRTFKGGGSSQAIGQQLAIRDSLKNAASSIENVGPVLDHLPWASTAAGEVATGHYTQGLLTAMNGLAKATTTGLATAVGGVAGSVCGPVGTLAGGVGANYVSSTVYDATAGKLFDAVKDRLGGQEDANQIRGIASDKMDLGSNPDQTLDETHAKYQAFVQARKDKEKADAEKKQAEAVAAEANKQAELAAADAARKQAADAAKQKSEATAARQRLQDAVTASKWDPTAQFACTEFMVELGSTVQSDKTGFGVSPNTHEQQYRRTGVEIPDSDKHEGDCFWVKNYTFDYSFQRDTARYRITGTLAKDMSKIETITISFENPSVEKNDRGNVTRETELAWDITLTGVRLDPIDEGVYECNMSTHVNAAKGWKVAQSHYDYSDTNYNYTLVYETRQEVLESTMKVVESQWDMSHPESLVTLSLKVKKRPGQ